MLTAYVVVVVAYTLVDRGAFARSDAPTTRQRREWTYWAVKLPYLACELGPLLEIVLGAARPTLLGMLAGGACVAIAAGLRWAGVTTLGKAFSASVETHRSHQLVDRGVYGVIRHPLYLGLALLYAGLPLFAGAQWTWIVTLLGWFGLIVRIRAEERWLTANLDGYAAYTARTKRLIPGVW